MSTASVPQSGFTDANFPKDQAQRTYHVGTRRGEACNRVLTVGDHGRALQIAQNLDKVPAPFIHTSKRNFTTVTGRYKGTPVTIIAIGMGGPNTDFFVREVREIVDGPMAIIRLGTCGCIGSFAKTGTIKGSGATTTAKTAEHRCGMVAVADECIGINRNYDWFLEGEGEPYMITKAIPGDPQLLAKLQSSLAKQVGTENVLVGMNAAADSFYGSQARRDPNTVDANDHLLEDIKARYPEILTFEMETFHLYHFGLVCLGRDLQGSAKEIVEKRNKGQLKSTVHTAGAHIIVADRVTNDFLNPAKLLEMQQKAGIAVLDALVEFEFAEDEQLHPEAGSVWEIK